MSSSQFFTAKTPVYAKRVIHFDLKGLPPTFERLMEMVDIFAAAKFNMMQVEWEDTFPWTVDKRFRCETAYTPDQVKQFYAKALDKGFEVVPLVQCLGHMETPLAVPGYEHLREVPDRTEGLNPLGKGARELIQAMVDDVLALMPGVKTFCLGGDEARTLGMHPETKAYAEKYGRDALYLQHVEPLLDNLMAKGIRPWLAHDMMVDWSEPLLKRLGTKCDLLFWNYRQHPDELPWESHKHPRYITRFQENGIKLWAIGCYKGCELENSDLVDYADRTRNTLDWVGLRKRYHFEGFVATGWNRWTTPRMQCVPFDGSMDSLVNVAHLIHDGTPLTREQAREFLGTIGQRERHEACYEPLKAMEGLRKEAWNNLQFYFEILTTHREDARRKGNDPAKYLDVVRGDIAKLEEIGPKMRKAFAGSIPEIWINRYLDERILAIKEALAVCESKPSPGQPKV